MCIYQWASLLCLGLGSLNSTAWQVDIQADTDNSKPAHVVVSNDRELHGMMIYLVWFDEDNPVKNMFQSWTLDNGWQQGLQPISNNSLDLKPFDAFTLTNTTATTCPETHRCFMGMIAIPPNSDPLNSDNWQAASVFPLNIAASKERIKGQRFFLSPTSYSNTDKTTVLLAPATVASAATTTTATSTTNTTTTTAQTEKPDILRLVNNELWYANAQAQRLQVIDVSNPAQPKLTASYTLKGTPREIYQLGQYTVLLETLNSQSAGTQLTVLTRGTDGKLNPVATQTLTGNLLQSRRRENVIYSVMTDTAILTTTDCIGCSASQAVTHIVALSLNAQGQLQILDEAKVAGYSPSIAIFPDYLVLANDNPQPDNWTASQIQVFDLSTASAPLQALPSLLVPGQVPSEFHLNVFNQQLRVVYGAADRSKGSSLAIYDLRSQKMPLLGKVDNIAVGEQLFATRFTDNRAFVVTYKRTDPLWVIDVSNSSAPKIVGELKVPGWSEKLFFNNDRLFAMGINDQPLPTETNTWVSRVATSLFDVKDPTNPKELSRFTPLAGEVSYSTSLALDDERALSLDWQQSTAVFPLTSWESQTGNHLQLLSFANDTFQDLGRLDVSTTLLRSLPLQANILAALGDQSLLTVQWGKNKPTVLAELELATSINWLNYQADTSQLWGAARGDNGYYRAYRYNPTDLNTPVQRWSLAQSYESVIADKNLMVFYNSNPGAVQVLDTQQGKLSAVQLLDATATPSTSSTVTWYDRSPALVKEGWLYIGEQRQFMMDKRLPANYAVSQTTQESQWLLRRWNLQSATLSEAPSIAMAGRPIMFTTQGLLVTQEYDNQGQTRLNTATISGQNLNLVSSRALASNCFPLAIPAEGVYVHCYTYQSTSTVDTSSPKPAVSGSSLVASSSFLPVQQGNTNTMLLKLDAAHNLADVGRWTWSGYHDVRAIHNDVAIVSVETGNVYTLAASTTVNSMLPYSPFSCELYRLDSTPSLLKKLDTCPSMENVSLTDKQGWIAQGFSGITTLSW